MIENEYLMRDKQRQYKLKSIIFNNNKFRKNYSFNKWKKWISNE